VKRVLLHSGKIHYDLLNEVDKRGDSGAFALVRLEQFYPLPTEQLKSVLARYPEADVMWVQDEPENQGAWPFLALELAPQLDRELLVSSRTASASPATGSSKRSAAEQTALIANALEF
jgi:2-oxoglutarate dehydrogenase E1 component